MSDRTHPPARMRYSLESRCRTVSLILSGLSVAQAAAATGTPRSSAYRWWGRYRAAGWAGLVDRSCVPHHQPRRLAPELEAEILAVRQLTEAGPQTIGAIVGRAASTVGKVLRRLGHSRPPRAPREPAHRYEHQQPGDLLHLDIKKLGRFWQVGKRIRQDGVQRSPRAGWQYVHVAVDDHSRLAYVEVLPAERAEDAVAFLGRALAWYREQGIVVRALLTDNGGAYRSRAFREARTAAGLKHRFTKPYRPRTNGKAERFIQTLLRQWAYRYVYPSSAHRARALAGWVRWYNRRRPHGSLGGLPPISRVSHLCGHYN